MNSFAIAGLFFVCIPSLVVGPFILVKGRKKVHLLWAAFLSAVALWGFGMFKIGTAANAADSLFWWRIAEIGVIFIPIFLVHFVISFLGLRRKIFLILFYVATAIFLYCNIFTDYFIKNLYFAFNQFYYISATPLYTVFICAFVVSVIYVLFELAIAYKKTTSILRYQIKYLILAFLVGFSGGITSYPPVYGLNVYPAWNATIFISVLAVAYAILRYRLMDIRIVVRKTVIYFLSAGFVYGAFYLIIWLYNNFFGSVYNNAAYFSGLILAPLFVGLFVWFTGKIKGITNKYLFTNLYNQQEAIAKLTDELTNSIDLNKISDSIVESMKNAMQTDKISILINQNKNLKLKIINSVGFNKEIFNNFSPDGFLIKHFQKNQKPIIRDEIQMQNPDDENLKQIVKEMKKSELSLCLPMVNSGKLIGVIILGNKIDGDAYTSDDLNLLNTLSKQAAIAIENANSYQEIQDFSKTLQQKVDDQTKEIRKQKEEVEKAFELEKKVNEELKELDTNKTDFMLITQHHLRTPLSVNAGFLDLLLNGTFGKVPVKIKDALHRLQESTQKEIDVVNELLDASSYQIGKEVIRLGNLIDFEILMEETLKDLTAEADTKGIYLKYEKHGKIPKIPADRTKLKLVLTNVIDNCIKYTAKGGVTVITEVKTDKLLITVKDTGIGLSNELIQNLFKKTFHRGEQAKRMFAVGKGLGLFLSGKIIEGHHGKIWAESKSDGNGSAFYIELPLKQDDLASQPLKVENNVTVK